MRIPFVVAVEQNEGDRLWIGYHTALIPYVRQQRAGGRLQYIFSRKLKPFLDASYLPIRFISPAALVTSVIGTFSFSPTKFWCLRPHDAQASGRRP